MMRRNGFLVVLLTSIMVASAWAACQRSDPPTGTINPSGDSPPGSIKLIAGYRYEALQGIDTNVGKVWKEGGLTIKHDIGDLAGLYAKPEEQADYLWYKEQLINGLRVRCALTKNDRLLVTFPRDHANFYVNFRTPGGAVDVTPEDVADVLLMVLTYQGREAP